MSQKRNILILGASGDIAKAIIDTLSDSLYSISTTSRRDDGSTYFLDVSDSRSLEKFESEIDNTIFDWIVYCPGFVEREESLSWFETAYGKQSEDINFTAPRRLLINLKKNIARGGGMICLSSTAGIWGSPRFPIYASWKGALNVFLLSLHTRYLEDGVHVFSICPGPTNTRMRQSVAGDAEMHQSPSTIGVYVKKIIEDPRKYSDLPLLVIRDGSMHHLAQELTLLSEQSQHD